MVYGAGAVGGVVGARLHQAGFGVTLIARGAHLDRIRNAGLTVESPVESVTLRIPAVAHPREIDWADQPVVLLATKSQHTLGALTDLAGVAPVGTPIVCLQNGIANEPAALRFFPRVQAVCVMCPAGHLEPGVVQAWSAPLTGLLDLGRFPDGADATTEEVSADLARSTFSSLVVPDIRRWKHRKLLTNLGNVVEAVCGPDALGSPLTGLLTAEGEAALAAAGLEAATRHEDRARRGDLLRLGAIAGRQRPGSSSWQSVQRGTGDIETDWLNGEIVALGRMHGVPTPANQLMQSLARQVVVGGRPPGTTSAATVLERLGQPG